MHGYRGCPLSNTGADYGARDGACDYPITVAHTSLAQLPQRSTKALSNLRKLRSVVGLIGIVVVAILISPTAHDGANIFLEPGNLTDILRQMSVIGIIALPMTYVILTAGIDLSVGSILALATALVAMFVTRAGPGNLFLHVGWAVCIAIGASALVGAANGVTISVLRIRLHRHARFNDRRARLG